MTFSICVKEDYVDEDGNSQYRFGVAVTTRLAAIRRLCPFASENGAVTTQSLVTVELGRKGVEYLDDGLAVDDALQALLNADDGAEQRQLHGVGTERTFAFSGEECNGGSGTSKRRTTPSLEICSPGNVSSMRPPEPTAKHGQDEVTRETTH